MAVFVSGLGDSTAILYRDLGGQEWGEDGRPVFERSKVGEITVSLQPLTGREWTQAELAGRHRDYVKVYTDAELRSGDQGDGKQCDRLRSADGVTYEVVNVLDYRLGPIEHYKAICRRVDESDGDGGP